MTFGEYQEAAMQTANLALDLWYALGKMQIEAGEAMQLEFKSIYHDKPYTREMMVEEIGDVLWHIALAAQELGVSLDAIAAANVRKLRARHGDTYNPEHYQERA